MLSRSASVRYLYQLDYYSRAARGKFLETNFSKYYGAYLLLRSLCMLATVKILTASNNKQFFSIIDQDHPKISHFYIAPL